MAVKCSNGHWYDPKMYKSCPHCKRAGEQLSISLDDVEEDDKTVSIAEVDISLGEQLGEIIGGNFESAGNLMQPDMGEMQESSSEDGDKTVSFGFFGVTKKPPVTGWLVCINGDEKGNDYRLHAGKNFVGRSQAMDVVLTDDKSISREKHCSVLYDPKGNEFYVTAEKSNIVYLNGDLVTEPHSLKLGDVIKVGETEWSAVVELLDEDGNVNIDTEEGREAMQFLYDLRFTHNFIDESATSNDDARIDFEAGKTGFMILATSNCLNLEGVDWDWTTALAGPDGEAKTFFAADSLVLFDKCEDKDLAMKAIKHLSSADVMSEFHKQITEQPPITKDEEYSGDERFKELYTTENDNFKTLTPFNSAVSLLTKVNENLQSMMMGEMKPEEVLKNAQDYYNENLASE